MIFLLIQGRKWAQVTYTENYSRYYSKNRHIIPYLITLLILENILQFKVQKKKKIK